MSFTHDIKSDFHHFKGLSVARKYLRRKSRALNDQHVFLLSRSARN